MMTILGHVNYLAQKKIDKIMVGKKGLFCQADYFLFSDSI